MSTGMGEKNAPAARDRNVLEIVKGLAVEPAYLLVFGLVFLAVGVLTSLAATGTLPAWLAATTIIVALVAGIVVVVVVEPRRSIPTQSSAQAKRLADVPVRESAVRAVLEDLVDPEKELYFVYSSTAVSYFVDDDGTKIEFPFTADEMRVTAIPDAYGIAKIHTLLELAQKREHLHVITSKDFRPEYWDCNLILIASPNANHQTPIVLEKYGSPYLFSRQVDAIVSADRKWPENPRELESTDYGLLVKIKRIAGGIERVYVVAAGIGGQATLAACHYLQTEIVELDRRFPNGSPFAIVLALDRAQGYTSVREVESTLLPLVSK